MRDERPGWEGHQGRAIAYGIALSVVCVVIAVATFIGVVMFVRWLIP